MSTSPPSSSAGRSAKPKATVITGTAAALAVSTSTIESPIKATLPPPALAMVSVRRSEEHTSELQSLMRISYAVFCLKKKTKYQTHRQENKKSRQQQTTRNINITNL